MEMTRRVGALLLGVLSAVKLAGATSDAVPAPQFTHAAASDWINSAPLRIESFRGRVLLIDVWAFECWNCYRSFPWLKDLETRLAPKGLAVVGVHSPELDQEYERDRVIAKVKEFGLHHPVMLDNDFSYWNALGNHYWPAYYVVDRRGVIQGRFVGETHAGDDRAQAIESLVTKLLAEPSQ